MNFVPDFTASETWTIEIFQINSRQYQLIRKLKPSENGISLKSLCDVLGDINCFPPLRASEDDEKKKLQELWLVISQIIVYHLFCKI